MPQTFPERRTHCRLRGLPVAVYITGQLHPTRAYDLSAAGVGVVLPHRVEAGTVMQVELPDQRRQVLHLKRLRVIHATPRPDGTWLVGGAFGQPLSSDELGDVG